ncbi:MAG: hypothetical protein AB8G15_16460 [Saprospiraceae bacterium]
MQNATKELYKKNKPSASAKLRSSQPKAFENLTIHSVKDLALAFSWITFLTVWINWSIAHDQYLLFESLPAFLIVTFLLLLRAVDRKN